MKKIFLICGIIASVLYIGTDTLLIMTWEKYSYNFQTISNLSVIGAQTRTTWLGVIECISVYSPMLWILVLAIIMLQAEKKLDLFNNKTI